MNSNILGESIMSIVRIVIDNFKSIKHCDLSLEALTVLIGENGTGKTTILEAIEYFYQNLAYGDKRRNDIFDANNKYSNEVKIAIYYDLSKFINISKSQMSLENPFEDEKTEYESFYHKISSMQKDLVKDCYYVVELSQIKNGSLTWNRNIQDRFLIKSLFPMFIIKLRELNVFDWDNIWEIIGELTKESNENRTNVSKHIKEILDDPNYKISNRISHIEKIFFESKCKIENSTSRNFAILLTKLYFDGDEIKYKERKANYFSTGTNAVHYLELLIRLIFQLSKDKLKSPIILFDEPELNLHQKYIDDLCDLIIQTDSSVQYIVSTHSPRMTKNIIKSKICVSVYKVLLLNKHTVANKIKLFSIINDRTVYKVTDEHANAYFSRKLLFVEGETELELFSNPYLQVLYPKLKDIDIFKAMSDDVERDIVLPSRIKTKTPYKIIIDMDKVLSYDTEKKKFSKGKQFDKLTNKQQEKYLYYNQNSDFYLYNKRKRIEQMINQLKIHYYLPFFSCDDINYVSLIDCIKDYFSYYNILICNTTIEGVLITKENSHTALDFLKKEKTKSFNDFYDKYQHLLLTDKINILRIIFNGKSDLLQSSNKYKFSSDNKELKDIIDKMKIGSKTSGWVSSFIEFFFNQYDIHSPLELEGNEAIKKEFYYHFNELNHILNKI